MLKYLYYYNYYDSPLDYLAEDETGQKYFMLFAEEDTDYRYIMVKINDEIFERLETDKQDVRQLFLEAEKVYEVLNPGETEQIIEITDFVKYLPEEGYTA
jgi:hypothetical protein